MASVRAGEASSSTSTSTSTSQYAYDVLLSFRGEDTRRTFTDHLYTALLNARFRTFRDYEDIEIGEDINTELKRAIEESRISIVVFSKNYVSSPWCLDELVMILKCRRTSGHVVLPIFYDVDPSQVRKQKGDYAEVFANHEELLKAEASGGNNEWMDKIRGWRQALEEVADLPGMVWQNEANGNESKFIEKIVKVVEDKLSRTILYVAPHPIGLHSRSKYINLWLQDGSTKVGIVSICGAGGIGKTTIAKFVYNLNFSRFEGSSFLANVREISKQQNGLICLQRQLLSDILKGRNEKINNVDEGIQKIVDVVRWKRVLIVLDDVDENNQLNAVLGMRDWLFPGSKIIITTRNEKLFRPREVCYVDHVRELDYRESLELFSWHAFGQNHPVDNYIEDSEKVVRRCGGLPLAIKILGSSLSGKSLAVWKSQIEKLQAIPNNEIFGKLKISYDSLQDDHDKEIFLHVACFFVGKDKDLTTTILDGCDFYATIGIQNLIERCLLTIDMHNKLEMHQLVQDMARAIVHKESLEEPGERSRICNHKDSFDILRENTGTEKIEGLVLDMHLLRENKLSRTIFNVNRKRSLEEIIEDLSGVGNLQKRYCMGQQGCAYTRNSNELACKVDAFKKMAGLKLLQLNNVQFSGSYKMFPKGLRWLHWRGFSLESIPNDFPLERLVVLEMPYSSLKFVWNGTKLLKFLKILDLSHSHSLTGTPNFSMLPNLERLILENCSRLVKVHESIGELEKLILLNLRDCKSLRKLPGSMMMLKFLETLDISGCSNLEKLPEEVANMESLTVLRADGIVIDQLLSTSEEEKWWRLFNWQWQLKPKRSPEISCVLLPRSLVSLSLYGCNLSEDSFPTDITYLSSLRELDLSHNLMSNLPDCIRGLTGLQELKLLHCRRLRSLTGLCLQNLQLLSVAGSTSLEEVSYTAAPLTFSCGKCDNLVEVAGIFKSEPLENVDKELRKKLGLFNLGFRGLPNIKLSLYGMPMKKTRRLQGFHERYQFYTYLPLGKVPPWFYIKNTEFASLSFTVPPYLNFRIRGLNLCFVYTFIFAQYLRILEIWVINKTKSMRWAHVPWFVGVPEAGEDMMCLSYWKFESHELEIGDEVKISIDSRWKDVHVKEIGVHIVYDDEEEEQEKGKSSTSQLTIAKQTSPYGNSLPGHASGNFYGIGFLSSATLSTLHK